MLAALLCLLAQGAAIAHVDFGAHGFCPEHGELVDLVAQPKAPGGTASTDPHPEGVRGLHVPAAVTSSGVDDHCLIAQLVRQVSPSPAAALPVRSAQASRVPTRSEPRVERPSWLLRLAPKQSPPA